MSRCVDCKRDPCHCKYTPVKNSVLGIRSYTIPGRGTVKYWPANWGSKGRPPFIEVHLTVNVGDFPAFEEMLEEVVKALGRESMYG